MKIPTDIAALIEQSRTGDAEAWTELTRLFSRRLEAKGYYMGLRWEDATDCAQEVLCRAWENRSKLPTDADALLRWFLVVMRNSVIDRGRKLQHERPLEELSPADPAQRVDDRLIAAELQARLDTAIRALPNNQRQALLMFYDEGLSDAEIEQRTGIKNPKMLRHRAIKKLRAEVKQ